MSDKKDDISSGMYGGYISKVAFNNGQSIDCLLYTSPSPRD